MKIFIELPTWLGDSVMSTPAIENIVKLYPDAKITLFGSFVSINTLKNHPNVEKVILDTSKDARFRPIALFKIVKPLNRFDLAISFRRTLFSKVLLFFIKSDKKFGYKRVSKRELHQVRHYNNFINMVLQTSFEPKELKLHFIPKKYTKPTIGINPGATYGSAKRWYPERFAKVALYFANRYDIVIFGSKSEVKIAEDIESYLIKNGVKNFTNLAGKTSIDQLIEYIAGLSLFITADSGPMHISAAYKIPTVSLFGPTKSKETSQWKNPFSSIIRHNIWCSPCLKRECPLNTHDCMKLIKSDEVIKEVQDIMDQKDLLEGKY